MRHADEQGRAAFAEPEDVHEPFAAPLAGPGRQARPRNGWPRPRRACIYNSTRSGVSASDVLLSGTTTAPLRKAAADGPLYLRVKAFVLDHIARGDWGEGDLVPSENQITRDLNVSRMTAHRALRELTAEGVLRRVQGIGTFVAEPKPQSELLEIRNIADEIAARGHVHTARVHLLRRERADRGVAAALERPVGSPVFHSILVHYEDGLAVQVEDRHVNPDFAPGYLDQDFTRTTPYTYLTALGPLDAAEHIIEAVRPDREARRLLTIGADEPCLLLTRRTWSNGLVVSRARLVHPGSRYRFGSRIEGPRGRATARPQP
ncbi:MAG: histidine utilization repressor [Rhodospirillaceae bacterium]|nr:histidine utilization repressor [Rhodospirillaceae bacterium]